MGGPRLTSDQQLDAQWRRSQGQSLREVAEALGCSTWWVSTHTTKAVDGRRGRRPAAWREAIRQGRLRQSGWTAETIALLDTDMPAAELARMVGVSRQAVWAQRRRRSATPALTEGQADPADP